jgi:hypothetical protein
MGNTCCSKRQKNEIPPIPEKNIKNIKNIKKMTNNEIKGKIEKIRSEKCDTIYFSVIYGIGTIGGIVILCFIPEPSIGTSIFLMFGSLTYYIKCYMAYDYEINIHLKELERRDDASIILVDIGKLYIDK